MQIILDDRTIYYETWGTGQRVNLFVHGFGDSLHTWDWVRDYFSDDFTNIALDLSGCGRSSPPPDLAYAQVHQAKVIARFAEAVSLENFNIVCHSLGGSITLHFLHYFREEAILKQVDKLVFINPVAYLSEFPAFLRILRKERVAQSVLRFLPIQVVAAYVAYLLSPRIGSLPLFYQHFMGLLRQPNEKETILESSRQILPENVAELVRAYDQIDIPALIVWGEKDRLMPVSLGNRLQSDLPRAELALIPNSGHNPHQDNPAMVFDKIRPFLLSAISKSQS